MIKILGVSLRGPKHRKLNEPLQDYFCATGLQVFIDEYDIVYGLGTIAGDFIAIAVADGASSAKLSHIGARLAVNSALSALPKYGIENMKQAFVDALNTLMKYSKDNAIDINELSTTLSIGIIHGNICYGAGIGDCAVVAMDEENVILLAEPMKGEDPNETLFLTSGPDPEAIKSLITVNSTRCNAIIVLSDGISGALVPYYDESSDKIKFKPYEKFFVPLINKFKSSELLEFKDWLIGYLKQLEETYEFMDDDKTIVIGVRI